MEKDVINKTSVYFKLLSEEAQNKIAKNILDEAIKPTNRSILLHPETGKVVDLKDLVESEGMAKGILIIKNILEKSSENPEKSSVKAYTDDDMKQLFAKLEAGTIEDPTEESFIKIVKESIEKQLTEKDTKEQSIRETQDSEEPKISGPEKFINALTDLIQTSQIEWGYSPKIGDLLYSSFLLSTISLVHTKGSEMNSFRSLEPSAVFEIYSQVGHDILDAWGDKESAPLGREMLVMGLMSLAAEYAADIEHEIISGEEIGRIFNPDGCDCNCENCSCIRN